MLLYLVIALGGAVGAVARYAVGGWVQGIGGTAFPWGTLIVNITGSLLLGFLYRFLEGISAGVQWRAFLAIGFCGAYTTFSTFSYETVRLMQNGEWSRVGSYVLGSVLIGLVGMFLGFGMASAVLRRV